MNQAFYKKKIKALQKERDGLKADIVRLNGEIKNLQKPRKTATNKKA